jgi:hypothetical protein
MLQLFDCPPWLLLFGSLFRWRIRAASVLRLHSQQGAGPRPHTTFVFRRAEFALPSKQFSSVFFRRLKVDLFKYLVFLPPGAGQNAAAVFDHAGMAAEIAGSVFRP